MLVLAVAVSHSPAKEVTSSPQESWLKNRGWPDHDNDHDGRDDSDDDDHDGQDNDHNRHDDDDDDFEVKLGRSLQV